jgi:hypothetical protein
MTRLQRSVRSMVVAAAFLVAAGCSKSSTGPNNNNGNSRMTASVNGSAFASTSLGGLEKVILSNRIVHVVMGQQTAGTNSTVILISLYNLRGTGRYPLGVNGTTYGGTAQVTQNAQSWITPLTGTAGEVNITTLTDTRIAGTFSFVAEAIGGSTGTRSVTNGQFDFPIEHLGTVAPLPDNAGAKVSGTIAGNAFYGATIAGALIASNTLIFNAISERSYYISFSLGNVNSTGTYALSTTTPFRYVIVSQASNPNVTWGSPTNPGSAGTVVINSFTASRITGTFTATLAPNTGATGTVAISGTFDVGRNN